MVLMEGKGKVLMRKLLAYVMCFAVVFTAVFTADFFSASGKETEDQERISQLMESMTLEQKIAQMIMPSITTWGDKHDQVKNLSDYGALEEALARHQYGGILLTSFNMEDAEQTVRLICDLQANNAGSGDAGQTGTIPYLVAADAEGGGLMAGTPGAGGMAIGATGENAEENARTTGRIYGEEMAALGINVNLAPSFDAIDDMTNPGLGIQNFSDEPETVTRLALAYKGGVDESGVITSFKYYPGAGEGGNQPTSALMTLDELKESGLAACEQVVNNGAELVMASGVSFPLFDEEKTLADGETLGYYPASLSPLILSKLLRDETAYNGVIITDVLESEKYVTEANSGQALFSGDPHTAAHDVQVAREAINAGCDILLVPIDLNNTDRISYYDEYIAGIAKYVEDGSISMDRIDSAVSHILALKDRHDILDLDTDPDNVDEKLDAANNTVGTEDHRGAARNIAQQSITLLKNSDAVPVTGEGNHIVIIGRTSEDDAGIRSAIERLKEKEAIDSNVLIDDRISGETAGEQGAPTTIIIDRYYDPAEGGQLRYQDGLTDAINDANIVICLSSTDAGPDQLQDDRPTVQGIERALAEAHNSQAKFILLSDKIPVDAARFQGADAIVCSYNAGSLGIESALLGIFGVTDMPGTLPLSLPSMTKGEDGKWVYSDQILYGKGYKVE